MTTKVDILKAWNAADNDNPQSNDAESYLADDFQNLDKDGNVVLDRAAYVGMGQLIRASFNDFKSVFSNFREESDGVVANFHFEGTFTGDVDLSAMGLGIIPANGKKIVWSEASAKFMIEDDKIVSIQEITGGMAWFLAPLGIKLPSA
jgi:predicted ester cyclase